VRRSLYSVVIRQWSFAGPVRAATRLIGRGASSPCQMKSVEPVPHGSIMACNVAICTRPLLPTSRVRFAPRHLAGLATLRTATLLRLFMVVDQASYHTNAIEQSVESISKATRSKPFGKSRKCAETFLTSFGPTAIIHTAQGRPPEQPTKVSPKLREGRERAN
jgi:hypothetical protein